MAKTKKSDKETSKSDDEAPEDNREECFVIMPISDPENYEDGHFQHVYDDIFTPAIEAAGYKPKRADDVQQTNVIHLDVVRRLVEAPMAVCDLSTRNPNVLFEFGFRQAFDRPTVLVQEKGTPRIFDTNLLRAKDYRPSMRYHEVLEDQKSITGSIEATRDAIKDGGDVNSLVKLLSLAAAEVKPGAQLDANQVMDLMRGEFESFKKELLARKRGTATHTTDAVDLRR